MSLVEQIQAEAVSGETPVSQLLRRVKLAAVKLGLDDVAAWVESELNGYSTDVPEYRQIRGVPEAHNPFHGWISIQAPAELMEQISRMPVADPIVSLERFLTTKGNIHILYAPQIVDTLNGNSQGPELAKMGLRVTHSAIAVIIDRVRDQVLDWAIGLEKAGIMGSGVGFTPAEQARAANVSITIREFHGNLNSGDLIGPGSRVLQGSTDSSVNLTSADGQLFANIEEALGTVAEDPLRTELIRLVRAMEAAQGSATFARAYEKFISSAANHMTLLAPFIPALTTILFSPGVGT